MIKSKSRNELRKIRHRRIRKRVFGTAERPRLNVFRSNRHIYVQVINDEVGHTLASASTLERDLKEKLQRKEITFREAAVEVGRRIAQRALEKGITKVVFDRGGYKYHGNIKALADAAREAGLKF